MLDGGTEPVVARTSSIEWPTVGLALVIYSGWGGLTWFHQSLPIWLLVPLGAWLIAWHGSLQHEIMHGHPTRSRAINTAIASVPIALWLPFERYRQTHLAHHCDERLTDPLDDPESWYWTEADWLRLGPVGRWLVRAQATLPGRMLIGPAWSIGRFWREEWLAIRGGDGSRARIWATHLAVVALVLGWVVIVCGMPVWLYIAAVVYPGTSLLLVRSFAEHRAHLSPTRRTAIVERAPLLGLLFLNNNLHAVHHRWPTLPWYTLPAFYARHRHSIVATADGGPIYRGYGDIWRRFWRRPHDVAVHPIVGRDSR